jgi:uncharacterized protein (TIGR00369 family)
VADDLPEEATTPESAERRQRARDIPLHEHLGLRWTWPEKSVPVAEVRMPVDDPAMGFTRNLHGGAIATMVDLACALAAARGTDFDPERESFVTVDMHVRYHGTPRTDEVVARAEIVRAGRQIITVDCRVTDSDDHLIATATFAGMRVARRDSGGPAL